MMVVGRVLRVLSTAIRERSRLMTLSLAVSLCVLGSVIAAPARTVAAVQWWNAAFSARSPISITEKSGVTLTNYQVRITLPYDSPMQSSFGDVRFTDANANELSYWRENYGAGGSASFWVRVPSIPALNTVVIYAYYGNPSVSTTSNIHSTFIFGDDFEDPGWTTTNIRAVNYGTASQYVSAGTYHQVGQPKDEPIAEIYQNGSLKVFPDNYVVEVSVEPFLKAGCAQINPRYLTVANKYECLLDAQYNTVALSKVVGNVWQMLQISPTGFAVNPGSWYQMKAVTPKEGATNRIRTYINGSGLFNTTDSSLSYTGLAFLSYDWNDAFHMAYDNFRVREYASVEPTTVIGARETIVPTPLPPPTPTANTVGTVASVPVSTGALNEYDLFLRIGSTSVSGMSPGQQIWIAATTTDFPGLLTAGSTLSGNLDSSRGWWILKKG
jgi:hypothetical protein